MIIQILPLCTNHAHQQARSQKFPTKTPQKARLSPTYTHARIINEQPHTNQMQIYIYKYRDKAHIFSFEEFDFRLQRNAFYFQCRTFALQLCNLLLQATSENISKYAE